MMLDTDLLIYSTTALVACIEPLVAAEEHFTRIPHLRRISAQSTWLRLEVSKVMDAAVGSRKHRHLYQVGPQQL